MKMKAWRRRNAVEGGGNTDRWLHSPCANLNLWIFKHLNRPEKCVYGVGGWLKYQIDICIYLLYICVCVWGTFVAAAALASTHFHFSWVFNQVWIIASFCLKGSRFPFVCVCVCAKRRYCVRKSAWASPSLSPSLYLRVLPALSLSLSTYACYRYEAKPHALCTSFCPSCFFFLLLHTVPRPHTCPRLLRLSWAWFLFNFI